MGVIDSSVAGGFPDAEGEGEDAWDERISLAPLMATLLLPILIGAIVVIKCVFGHCFARKTTTKEEMYGVEGRMTMLINSDAAFLTPSTSASYTINSGDSRTNIPLRPNPNPAIDPTKMEGSTFANKAKLQNNNNNPDVTILVANELSKSSEFPLFHRSECDLTDSLKRTTGKRQLPDLPELPLHSLGHPPRRSSSVLSHDGTSELYATVGEVPNPYAHLKTRHSVPNEVCQPSTSRGVGNRIDGSKKLAAEANPSSDSETYATSNHPYAKLKRAEHPYARVRNASVGNDEETDTDNYDLPLPYTQSHGRTVVGGSTSGPQIGTGAGGVNAAGSSSQGPVPPRRIGRQWRGSQPHQQNSVDSVTHFSGDSQDSRGYTSISVREPLSNIRSQVPRGRNGDSHYATVSDDSEEMYAAIDDSSEGNYMQIPEGSTRPSWLDAANVASPIPERREANSPLPPVPAVPPPLDGGGAATAPPISPMLAILPQTPPVYAQVTKKTKKNKAPVTPTTSNASISSQTFAKEPHTEIPIPGPSSVLSSTSNVTHNSSHHRHHRSKSRTLMDNSNLLESNISEHRRWSKADISYSEFEVVREPSIPTDTKKSPVAFATPIIERQHGPASPRESSGLPIAQELVDEDNYNVIPDKRQDQIDGHRNSRDRNSSGRARMDSDNYQEIEPISNTYQEIGHKEPSDHYQEIGAGLSSSLRNGTEDDNDNGSGLYQEIRKDDIDGYEEEEEDQFYEKVRPSATTLSVPAQSISGRKHGYEKIKKKIKPPSPKGKSGGISSEEDEEERAEEDDAMYEKVKYPRNPPYERLKESRSDLAVDVNIDDEDEGNNFYEHIGYSRVKSKNKALNSSPCRETVADLHKVESEPQHHHHPEEVVDLNQLYAVVDKTKKKSKNCPSNNATSSSINNNNPRQNYNNNNPIVVSNLSSSSTTLPNNSSARFSPSGRSNNTLNNHKITKVLSLHSRPDLDFIDDTNDIEYI